MKKTVFFDVMGVVFIVGDDTNDLLVPFVQDFNKNISKQEIVDLYLKASMGNLSSYEFWKNVGINDGDVKKIEREYLDKKLILNDDIINVFNQLKLLGYDIGLLSNDVSEWSLYLRKKYDLERYLEYCIISGDVNTRKPNTDIYKIIIEKLWLNPIDCIFIDDRIKNLLPAQKLGFNVLLCNPEVSSVPNINVNYISKVSQIIDAVQKIFKGEQK